MVQVGIPGSSSCRCKSFRTADGGRLGKWVISQRSLYNKGTLAPERSARLAALPGWVWDSDAASWEENVAALEVYGDREGHAHVPQRFRTADGRPLGPWVARQRTAYHQGTLDPERIARLAALPGWVWDSDAASWEENVAALEVYGAREGDARVHATFQTADGRTLGNWVSNQRTAYHRGTLAPERIARLQALEDWVWEVEAAEWEENFAALKVYGDREEHARVPSSFRTADGRPLGPWVHRQRTAYHQGTLDPERIARLEALPGWVWDARAAKNKGCDRDVRYRARMRSRLEPDPGVFRARSQDGPSRSARDCGGRGRSRHLRLPAVSHAIKSSRPAPARPETGTPSLGAGRLGRRTAAHSGQSADAGSPSAADREDIDRGRLPRHYAGPHRGVCRAAGDRPRAASRHRFADEA